MKYINIIGWLWISWLASFHDAWAEDKTPLTVKAFIAKESLERPDISGLTMVNNSKTIPSLHLGPTRPLDQFEVEGYVQTIFKCPECPANMHCEPCGDYMIISDQESCTPVEKDNIRSCPDVLGLWLDYPNNYASVTKGTKIRLKVEIGISTLVTQMITPEDRKQSERNQRILKETFDKQPGFQPAPRPEWLKNIPGETYKMVPVSSQ